MPCQGGPTNEELAFAQRMSNDPVYAAKMRERWRRDSIKAEKLREKWDKEEREELENEMKYHTLENIFFKSSMTVFLCRTMQIVISNFGYRFLPEEFEWWWHEHGWRDTHNDVSKKSPEEIAKKVIEISKKYKVCTIPTAAFLIPITEDKELINTINNPQEDKDVSRTDDNLLNEIE